MNKVTKGFLIAACVCIVLGIVITVGAIAAGGLGMTRQMAENGELSYGLFWNEDISNWHWGWHDGYDDDGDFFDDSQEVYRSDITRSYQTDKIKSLDIEIGAAKIVTKQAADTIEVSTKNVRRVQIYEEDGILYIRGLKSHTQQGGTITIAIPKEKQFEDITLSAGASDVAASSLRCDNLAIELGAGKIVVDELQALESYIEVGAGKIDIQNATLKNSDVHVGMGDFSLEGSITGDLTGECGMGNFSMRLTGRESDHNYDLECAAGNMSIGNSSYSGLASDRVIDNRASSDFDLECAMGNLDISFRDR